MGSDLLIMKAVARRPKDLQEIVGLLAAHPDADIVAVRQWVRECRGIPTVPIEAQDLVRYPPAPDTPDRNCPYCLNIANERIRSISRSVDCLALNSIHR